MPTRAMVPCKNNAGASSTTEPSTAGLPGVPCSSRASNATATTAATKPPSARVTCTRYRAARGRKASTSTPATPIPNTISMGESRPYSMLGVT